MNIGDRAKYVGPDKIFHPSARMGKLGTIVLDAALGRTGNFGGGTCGWQMDGDKGVYITGLDELEIVK